MGNGDKYLPDGTVDYGARRRDKNVKKKPGVNAAKWNRRPDENDAQFGAYRRYRDLEPRDRMPGDFGPYFELYPSLNPEQVAVWFEEFNWQERVLCWDRSTASRLAWRKKKTQERMNERHANLGTLMTTIAAEELNRVRRRSDDEPLPIRDIIALTQTGAAIERVANDKPSDVIDVRTKDQPLNLKALSIKELKALRAMKEKTKVPEGDAE